MYKKAKMYVIMPKLKTIKNGKIRCSIPSFFNVSNQISIILIVFNTNYEINKNKNKKEKRFNFKLKHIRLNHNEKHYR